MSKETGGPAFPVPLTDAQEAAWNEAKLPSANGMTLRDYFAAKAMQGWLSTYPSNKSCGELSINNIDVIARFSYSIADAMIKAREQ